MERQNARQEHRQHLKTEVQLHSVIGSNFHTETSVQRHSATVFVTCMSLKAVILKLPFLSICNKLFLREKEKGDKEESRVNFILTEMCGTTNCP